MCASCSLRDNSNSSKSHIQKTSVDHFLYKLAKRKLFVKSDQFLSHSISLSGLGFPAISLKELKIAVFHPQIEEELANQIIPSMNTNQKTSITVEIFQKRNQYECLQDFPLWNLTSFLSYHIFKYLAVAWTGIAAMLLPRGRTTYSNENVILLKFPTSIFGNSVSSVKISSKVGWL